MVVVWRVAGVVDHPASLARTKIPFDVVAEEADDAGLALLRLEKFEERVRVHAVDVDLRQKGRSTLSAEKQQQ